MRVLIVEDEPDLARAIRRALEEDGLAVDVALDGEAGAFQAAQVDYDLILLDLMLPGIDGFEVLERLRRRKATPVLVLTARDGVSDRVRGLDGGADDYLVKPFALAELRARIRALIRRAAGQATPLLEAGDVALDTRTRTVTVGGRDVGLSPREYAIAEFLMMHKGELVTRSMLLDHLYDDDSETASNVVDVHISNLRRKLGAGFVRTRRGHGYLVDA